LKTKKILLCVLKKGAVLLQFIFLERFINNLSDVPKSENFLYFSKITAANCPINNIIHVSIFLIEFNIFLGKLKDSVKNEIEDLVEKVNEKLDEIDNESKANAGHVDNLREVNKELLERIKVNVQDDIDKQTGTVVTR
jgi:hypothetical protein